MPGTVLLCSDGSDLSVDALSAGLAVLEPQLTPVLVTIVEPSDPSLVTGTGFAGGVISPDELDAIQAESVDAAKTALASVADRLGLAGADARVVVGFPAQGICDLAAEIGASAIVIGSRGRGGLKRAVLGSVSDHVVRHAPCPVVVTAPDED